MESRAASSIDPRCEPYLRKMLRSKAIENGVLANTICEMIREGQNWIFCLNPSPTSLTCAVEYPSAARPSQILFEKKDRVGKKSFKRSIDVCGDVDNAVFNFAKDNLGSYYLATQNNSKSQRKTRFFDCTNKF